MRWFTRVSVVLLLMPCAWIAWPERALARPPEVHTVIEGRNEDGAPLVILVGSKVKALRDLTVVADDGVSPRYEELGTIVSRSGTLAVWKLPVGIEGDRGPDQYSLVFTYGKKARQRELTVRLRLDFGSAAPNSVHARALTPGSVDQDALALGLRQDLDDAVSLDGRDVAFFRDASNLNAGILDPARFSALDDLDAEGAVGVGATQVAAGDHLHDLAYVPRSALSASDGAPNEIDDPVDWTQLRNVPDVFATGGYQAGAGLALSSGTFSVQYEGSGSAPTASRSDHNHTGVYEPDFQPGSGLDLTSATLSVVFGGTGGSNSAARSDHDHDLTYAPVGPYFTQAELSTSGTFNDSTNPVHWSRLQAVPVGNGLELSLTGVFSADYGGNGSATSLARSDHHHDLAYEALGHDHTGTYQPAFTVGTGLTLSSGTLTAALGGNGSAATLSRSDHDHDGDYLDITGNQQAGEINLRSTTATCGIFESTIGHGLFAITRAGAQFGVRVQNTDTTGKGGGIDVTAASNEATGVQVRVSSTSGATRAFFGQNDSTGGTAFAGEAHAATGTTYAFDGGVSSPDGVGGRFSNASGTGDAVGCMGQTSSSDGRGVYGFASDVSGDPTGVYGESRGGWGVFGVTQDANCGGVFGRGHHQSDLLGIGVRGLGEWGVYGESGSSSGGRGVYGQATNAAAVGTYGENTATTGSAAYGVMGVTDSTVACGVYGLGHGSNAGTGTGVLGDGEVGVKGMTSATAGVAVRGEATDTAGATTALQGTTVSSAGIAGLLVNSAGGAASTTLQVEHTDTSVTSGNLAIFRDQGSNVARIDRTGQGLFNGGTATSGADFAESVAVNAPKERFEPGDVIVIDTRGVRRFALSSEAQSPLVAGIYSTRPGVLARPGDVAGADASWRETEIPLAITGIVPCKVCDEGGAIRAGDLLVSASVPGHARKAPADAAQGTIVAKALGHLARGRGRIEVPITMR